MPILDHLTIIAPSLAEGLRHVRECLGIELTFGRQHPHMGTHNRLLDLGDSAYLEVIAVDPDAPAPAHPRWFGLSDAAAARQAWDEGRRLRGWVARTSRIDAHVARHRGVYGDSHEFGSANGSYCFAIPPGGVLPMDGLAPSLIDRRGKSPFMPPETDKGCRLAAFRLLHPDPSAVAQLYQSLRLQGAPEVAYGDTIRYVAEIETPAGLKTLC